MEKDIETKTSLCHSKVLYKAIFVQKLIEIGSVVFALLNHKQRESQTDIT